MNRSGAHAGREAARQGRGDKPRAHDTPQATDIGGGDGWRGIKP